MYAFRASIGPVDLAFTDRLGGVSAAPWDSLNLAVSGPDDEAAKVENHRRLMADFADGERYFDLYQVHGDVVDVVEDRVGNERPEADGIVTALPHRTLLVRAADCVPIVYADPDAGVIGAAHAGRRGVEAGVVVTTAKRMRDLGAQRIIAWVGPHICGGCYEVPEEMRAEVSALIPEAFATTTWGTPSLDLGAAVRAQLESCNVEVNEVGACTFEREDLFSFRRDGENAGRFAGVIRLRSAA